MESRIARVAYRWLLRLARGKLVDQGYFSPEHPEWGRKHLMRVGDDLFVHFTTSHRADQIVASGKLLMNPPYKKFGIDAVNAVSAVWGSWVPGVQLNHVRSVAKQEKDHVVALVFKTNTKPDYGTRDEVIWKKDVNLQNPRILPLDKGASMLMSTPESIGEGDQVYYQ